MIYSEVVKAGLILPAKAKYTKRDVDRVILDSLFSGPVTRTLAEAVCIVKCSAIYHDTDYSSGVRA